MHERSSQKVVKFYFENNAIKLQQITQSFLVQFYLNASELRT